MDNNFETLKFHSGVFSHLTIFVSILWRIIQVYIIPHCVWQMSLKSISVAEPGLGRKIVEAKYQYCCLSTFLHKIQPQTTNHTLHIALCEIVSPRPCVQTGRRNYFCPTTTPTRTDFDALSKWDTQDKLELSKNTLEFNLIPFSMVRDFEHLDLAKCARFNLQ